MSLSQRALHWLNDILPYAVKCRYDILPCARRNFPGKKIGGCPCPREFHHRFMYIASSSDHSLLTLKLPFKVVLWRFKVLHLCLKWEWCTFKKTENSYKSTITIMLTRIDGALHYHLHRDPLSATRSLSAVPCLCMNKRLVGGVIRHLLRRQLLLWWYLQQQRVRVRVMIGFLVQGRVRIKIRIRVRVRVGVMFNVSIYHGSNCRQGKCRTFVGGGIRVRSFFSFFFFAFIFQDTCMS